MKKRKRKIPLWLPYTSNISVAKSRLDIEYKGGKFSGDMSTVHSIMFYGAVCDLPESFLQLCAKYRVPVTIHRRNMTNAVWITPSTQTGTQEDMLERQLLVRANKKKSGHIARRLLFAKFESMSWLVSPPFQFSSYYYDISAMRALEAQHAKRYWSKYFTLLGASTDSRRGANNPIKSTLDAVSKLIHGVLLRYVLYHRLSPHHAFLHLPTNYPSLVYDLMEPYRGYIDKVVFNTVQEAQKERLDAKEYLPRAIVAVEDLLDTTVYSSPTRQLVTFQELLHGSVLALRAYILGEAHRFMPPIPGTKNGGRPVRAGYRLYGRSAGPTDFWVQAEEVVKKHERRMQMAVPPDGKTI